MQIVCGSDATSAAASDPRQVIVDFSIADDPSALSFNSDSSPSLLAAAVAELHNTVSNSLTHLDAPASLHLLPGSSPADVEPAAASTDVETTDSPPFAFEGTTVTGLVPSSVELQPLSQQGDSFAQTETATDLLVYAQSGIQVGGLTP